MSKKSTHSGECQLCGRNQKLPGGRLSLHGYSVQWNMFMGICPGAGLLPYELSCADIPPVIEHVKLTISSLQADIAKLLTPTTDEQHKFFRSLSRPENRYKEHDPAEDAIVVSVQKTNATGDYTWNEFYFEAVKDGFRKHISFYGMSHATLLDAINKLRAERAKIVEFELGQRQSYLAWLIERVEKWTLKTLKAVADEPKKFKVGIRRNSRRVGGVTVTFPDGTKAYKATYKLAADAMTEWNQNHK